jgi:uncharacterized membrane protein
MHPSGFHFWPLAPYFFLGLAIFFVVAIALVELGILSYAYEKMGVNRRYVFLVLFLALLGSYVNIPVARLGSETVLSGVDVDFFGVHYTVPVVRQWPGTVLAVNVGGAIIPTILSVYLLVRNRLYVPALLGVIVVTAVVHHLAEPVMGVGIAVPTFVPPIIAAAIALLLSRDRAAPLAYISGTLGTLIGADLLNLGHLAGLGAPVASIGGAGTFDGVFLTGIIAVLLA